MHSLLVRGKFGISSYFYSSMQFFFFRIQKKFFQMFQLQNLKFSNCSIILPLHNRPFWGYYNARIHNYFSNSSCRFINLLYKHKEYILYIKLVSIIHLKLFLLLNKFAINILDHASLNIDWQLIHFCSYFCKKIKLSVKK